MEEKIPILGKDFTSSSRLRRIKFLKDQGYIAKDGPPKGKGPLYLTDLGKYILEGEQTTPSIQRGINGTIYLITVKKIEGNGTPLDINMKINTTHNDILENLARMGSKNGGGKKGEAG